MKAKHIVMGIAAIGTGALAVVNYAFESKAPDLCEHPEKYVYTDYVRQVETRFNGKQLFDVQMRGAKRSADGKATLTCMKKDRKNEDGTQDYMFSSEESIVLHLRTGKSKKSGNYLVGVVNITLSTGQPFNDQALIRYLDLIPKEISEMEAGK